MSLFDDDREDRGAEVDRGARADGAHGADRDAPVDGDGPAGEGGAPVLPAPRRQRLERGRARRGRRRGLLVLGVLALLVAPFGLALGWFWYEVDPPGGPGRPVDFEVQPGWGTRAIADRLVAQGVVGSSLAFQAWAKVSGTGPFRAGAYRLHTSMGARAAADALARPPAAPPHRTLVLPPGLTLARIAQRVGRLRGLSAARFLAAARSNTIRSRFEPPGVSSLEGLTGPDTYFVAPGEREDAILRRLVEQFDRQAGAAGLDSASNPHQAVIVASLVETEAKLDEDRPLIAAVVANRLQDGMPLQIDATVLYARGSRGGPITAADRALDSPYNTYQVSGLPPTPIATVSRASLEAALHPAAVPYRYYVLIDRNGKHAFATTFAEHERNVAEARKKGLLR